MWLRNVWATDMAVYGWESDMKWAYLVSLSITTRMVLKVLDLGRPSMKSMQMVCQAWSGIGKGCRRPGSLQCSDLD
jgi:hypothetical protein